MFSGNEAEPLSCTSGVLLAIAQDFAQEKEAEQDKKNAGEELDFEDVIIPTSQAAILDGKSFFNPTLDSSVAIRAFPIVNYFEQLYRRNGTGKIRYAMQM